MTDRDNPLYEPNFDIDYRYGEQAQLFVESIRDSIANGRIEVKHDSKALKTGNLYVEGYCRKRAGWKASGINTTEADVWIFVLSVSLAIVVPTVVLQAIYDEFRAIEARRAKCMRGSHPTTGVLVPIHELRFLVERFNRSQGEAA